MRVLMVGIVALALLVGGGCVDDGTDTATSTTTESISTTTRCEAEADPAGTLGIGDSGTLCLDPAVVPATVGPVETVVTGTGWDAFGSLYVYVCPPAGSVPAGSASTPESESGVPGIECVGDPAQAREDGILVNLDPLDGIVSTPLRFELDQAMIDAGELVVVVGDFAVPIAGAATLQIGE